MSRFLYPLTSRLFAFSLGFSSAREKDVEQSLAMQEAESKRFQNGASDFFLVNVREETAANAQILRFSTILAQWTAHANYVAATMDFAALKLQ